MTTYRIKFEVLKDYDDGEDHLVGEYWATVDAETPEEAQKMAIDELDRATSGRHRYRLVGTHDMPSNDTDPVS
jgi:hypothetical protein